MGKAGGGIALVSFTDGEGDKFSGTDGIGLGGVGLGYSLVRRTLWMGLWADYMGIIEGGGQFA